MEIWYSDFLRERDQKETCWYCQWELNEGQKVLMDLDFTGTFYCNDKCAKDMNKENKNFASRTEEVLLRYDSKR